MDDTNPKSAGKRAPRKTAPAKAKTGGKAPAEPNSQTVSPLTTALPAPENGKSSASRISPEERHRLIAEAAYFRATRRGFSGDAEVEDWLAAEAEIDGKLLGNS